MSSMTLGQGSRGTLGGRGCRSVCCPLCRMGRGQQAGQAGRKQSQICAGLTGVSAQSSEWTQGGRG